MASMFDTIADMLRGSAPDDLAHALGTDRTQTRRAMEIGLPALITGLRDKTLEAGGASNLATMLDEPGAALPSDLDAYLAAGDPSQGATMLDVAFGDRGEPALSALSTASGLSTRLLAQVMSVLAPLATGTLANAAERTPDGLRAYLAGAVDDLETKGFRRVVELVSPDIPAVEPVPVVPDVPDEEAVAGGDDSTAPDDEGDATVVEGAFGLADDDLDLELDVDEGIDADEMVDAPDDAFGIDDSTEVVIPGAMPSLPTETAEAVDVVPGSDTAVAVADAPAADEPDIDVDYDDGRAMSAMGWLWWLIAAVLGVLILLFLISQCGDDDDEPAEQVVTDTTDDAPTPTPDPLIAQRQQLLDEVLVDYPGVSGEVIQNVAVLTGSVPDERSRALVDQAVRATGLGVQNNVVIAEVAEPQGYSLNDLVLAQPELSTLRALLEQAGLGQALDGAGPFTLFAPTNDAFATLAPELADITNDQDRLRALLQYHLMSDRIDGATVAGSQTLDTLQGEPITVAVTDSMIQLNGSVPVLVADAQGWNGVMHVISGVLVPPSAQPAPEELGAELDLAPITFDLGSSDLTDAGKAELDKVVEFLLATPINIEIGGHTDSDGDAAFNQQLSQQRADAVLAYLTEQGVPADTLTAVGYGEDQPLVDNDTPENKAQNRRIEFRPT